MDLSITHVTSKSHQRNCSWNSPVVPDGGDHYGQIQYFWKRRAWQWWTDFKASKTKHKCIVAKGGECAPPPPSPPWIRSWSLVLILAQISVPWNVSQIDFLSWLRPFKQGSLRASCWNFLKIINGTDRPRGWGTKYLEVYTYVQQYSNVLTLS